MRKVLTELPLAERTALATRVTWVGIVVNLLVMAAKLTAAILGQSRALMADAVESIGDVPANLMVLGGIILAARPADESHDYGHGKIETLAAAITGVLLIVAGGWIFWSGASAVYRSLRGEIIPAPGMVALVVTVLAIAVKEWLYRFTAKVGRAIDSQVVMANAWHHRSDAVTSLGTLAGVTGAIFLGERWRVLDPLAGAIASLLILRMGWNIARANFDELVEASESREKEDRILALAREVPGVANPHCLRTRRVGSRLAMDLHVEVPADMSVAEAHEMATVIEGRLRDSFGTETIITVHVEPPGVPD